MIKEQISKNSDQDYWERFVLADVNWLQNFYHKKNVNHQVIQNTINKHKEHLNKLKDMISKLQKNKSEQGEYMKRFADERHKSYMPFKVTMTSYAVKLKIKMEKWLAQQKGIQSKAIQGRLQGDPSSLILAGASKQEIDIYSKMYENYKKITILLSNQRYRFKNIAKHYFIKDLQSIQQSEHGKTSEEGFIFQVEKGIPYSAKINSNDFQPRLNVSQQTDTKSQTISDILSPLIIYLMVRDVAKAIIELEKSSIYHADIKTQNTICICQKIEYLYDKRHIIKLKQVTFKVMDFDRAFFMAKGQTKQQQALFKLTTKIIKDMKCFQLPQFSRVSSLYTDILNTDLEIKAYKDRHATRFQVLFGTLCLGVKQKSPAADRLQEKTKMIVNLIRKRQYKELIKEMKMVIDREIEEEMSK